MEDFLTYLKKYRNYLFPDIVGVIHLAPFEPGNDCYYELAKRPVIEWMLKHDGKIDHRCPGKPQLVIRGSYKFWKDLVAARPPGIVAFSIPPKK
jgi:hypothetical protein